MQLFKGFVGLGGLPIYVLDGLRKKIGLEIVGRVPMRECNWYVDSIIEAKDAALRNAHLKSSFRQVSSGGLRTGTSVRGFHGGLVEIPRL